MCASLRPFSLTFRNNDFGKDFWDFCLKEGLTLRLKTLNGKQNFNSLAGQLAAGEVECLDLEREKEHQLFYAVLGLLHKSASRLTTLNLRWAESPWCYAF